MNFLLYEFDGSARRNRNQEAMIRSMNSRDDFMQKLEDDRKRRREDTEKEKKIVVIQSSWRRHKARKLVADRARSKFDAITDAKDFIGIANKIRLLYLCYDHAVDDGRLIFLCGETLTALRERRPEQLNAIDRYFLAKTVLRFLKKAGSDTNLVPPLRVLGEISDPSLALKLFKEGDYFKSMLRHISYFTPMNSLSIDERLPPKLESMCEYLLLPITNGGTGIPKLLSALLQCLCKMKPLLPAITVVLPYLTRVLPKIQISIPDLCLAAAALKSEANNEMVIYAFNVLMGTISLATATSEERLQILEIVAHFVEKNVQKQQPHAKRAEPMDTDSGSISDLQALSFIHHKIPEQLASPDFVNLCLAQANSHEASISSIAKIFTLVESFNVSYRLSSNKTFIRALWNYLQTAGVQGKLGFKTYASYLRNGIKLDEAAQASYLPAFSLFSAVFGILVRELADDKFAKDSPDLPFSYGELIQVVTGLRDTVLGLIDLAFPDDLNTREKNRTEEGKREAQRWADIYENLVQLLRTLEEKDLRVHFLPEGIWSDHNRQIVFQHATVEPAVPRRRGMPRPRRPAFSFVQHLFQRPGTSSDSDSSSDDDGTNKPILTPTDLRNLSIMKSIPFVVTFRQRIKMFEEMLENDKDQHGISSTDRGHPMGRRIEVTVRRQSLYEDALDGLSLRNAADMRYPMRVHMVNWAGLDEAGIDGGGIFREFLSELVRTAFDPERGFYVYTSDRMLYPNPLAPLIYEDYSRHYYFHGRIIAKLLYEKQLAEIRFADFFLAQLLGDKREKNVDIYHMKSYDPVLYEQLQKLKFYDKAQLAELELDFTIILEEFGAVKTVELLPGGSKMPVTMDNRLQYIQLYCNFLLYKRLERTVDSMRAGVANLFDMQFLAIFSPNEIQRIVSGADVDIDVEDMRRYTVVHTTNPDDDVFIERFWDIVRSRFDPEEKRALLKFITGCSRPPLDGFKSIHPQIGIQLVPHRDALPTAATCMNLLKLPMYKGIDEMESKIRYAINAGAGFELS
ncbi:unnamed protein product, partial [Mesorhabditis spiculigera]